MDTDERSTSGDEARIVDEVRQLAFQCALLKTDSDTADDIAQEVAIDCLLRFRRNRWRVAKSQEALVASMTRRKLSRLKEKTNNLREREEQFMAERTARCPAWMNPAHEVEQREEEVTRAQALEELPEKCRNAFLLVREHGVTHRAVARRLGISLGLVVKHVARAERHLADRLIHVRTWNATPPTMRKPSWGDAHRPRRRRAPVPGESLTTPDRGGST